MTTIEAFFPQIRVLFSNFRKKDRGDLPRLPPLVTRMYRIDAHHLSDDKTVNHVTKVCLSLGQKNQSLKLIYYYGYCLLYVIVQFFYFEKVLLTKSERRYGKVYWRNP